MTGSRLAGLLFTLVLWAAGAWGAEYFVGPVGDDAADGRSRATAWRTLGRGFKDLKPGDTLTLTPGVYDEQVTTSLRGEKDRPILIRAERQGFAVIKASRRVDDFRPAAGARFVGAKKVPFKAFNVTEVDTGRMLLRAPSPLDLDQFRNAYVYDESDPTLYVHSSDGLPASSHAYEVTHRHGDGLTLNKAQHVHIEGLVFQGHFIAERSGHGNGVFVMYSQDCEIRQCAFIYNGGGVSVAWGCEGIVVRGCYFLGNRDPLYGELAQLLFSGKGCDRCVAIDNVVLDADTHGIRFYGESTNGTAIGNIIRNSNIGLYFKASSGSRRVERNVVVGAGYFNFSTGGSVGPFTEKNNTFEQPSHWEKAILERPDPSDLVFGKDQPTPGFCDPDHLDFRLQADSPCRGKGPGGSDLGAHPFEGNVFFVSPTGDDGRDGLSVGGAWRTLGKACAAAGPGSTVYLLAGEHRGCLAPAQSGSREKPIVFRSRGRGVQAAVIAEAGPACNLTGWSHVRIEDLRLVGREHGLVVGGEGIAVSRCVIETETGEAVRVENATDLDIRRTLVRQPADAAVRLRGENRNVSVTGSVLSGGGPCLVDLGGTPATAVFADYNDYVTAAGVALFAAGGRRWSSLPDWRKATGLDTHSLTAAPKFSDAATGGLASDSPLLGAGHMAQNIGPGEVVRPAATEAIAEAAVREVTPTTASFTWWTPHTSSALWRTHVGWWVPPPPLSRLCYGPTPACEHQVTSHGDLYHRVSVFDLKPGVKCYYRMELCRTEAATPVASFTTPAAETWRPARRRLHVAMTGSDANDGLTPARAFRTITKAGEEARAGDTVVVAQGVYRETFAPVATGVEGAPIVFQSETPNGAVLDGSNYHRPSGVALIRKGHVVIDGFVLRSFAHVLGTRAGYDYAQVLVWDSRNVTVRNCVQYGYGKYGLAAQVRGSRDVGWRNNAVIGFANGLVFHATGDNMRVVQNTFYVPQIRHIIVHDCEGFVMRNNLFFGKHEQKYKVACIAIENARKKEMDCNAFVFNANDSCRYVGGRGDDPDAQSLGLGLEGWRQAMKGDPHSVELGADAVRFAAPGINAYDPAFDAFWGPYTRGEKTPTLGLFDLPRGHVLDSAGEGGGVIGARPVAGQSASGTGRP